MFKSRWTPFLNDHTQISIWKGHSHMIDLQIFRSRWTHTRNKHTTKIKKECQTGGFLVIRHKSCESHKTSTHLLHYPQNLNHCALDQNNLQKHD